MTREVLQSCHAQITPFIHRTPILTSRLLDEMAGCQIFFKCENFQKMGAFKMRGAMNAVLNLNKDQLEKREQFYIDYMKPTLNTSDPCRRPVAPIDYQVLQDKFNDTFWEVYGNV